MGFRFRKTIRILPGLRLNISKSGLSTSIGGKGATLNLGPRGARGTVGIPGTGLSYSTMLGGRRKRGSGNAPPGAASTSGAGGLGCLLLLIGLVALAVLGRCAAAPDVRAPEAPIAPAPIAATETAYVTASRLNCRAEPVMGGAVVRTLARGDAVQVGERRGDWAKIAGDETCWAASAHLAASPAAAPLSARRAAAVAPQRSFDSAPDCPCSGGEVCVGRRGGRYCITSGGNKRYGV